MAGEIRLGVKYVCLGPSCTSQHDLATCGPAKTRTTKKYLSDRGFTLVYSGTPGQRAIVTVENYMKWYSLWLVRPDGSVVALPYPSDMDRSIVGWSEHAGMEVVESPWVDHVPNPRYVLKFAKENGWEVDNRSLEMMIGRWELEIKGNYGRF